MKIGLHLHPHYKTISKSLPRIIDFLVARNQEVFCPDAVKDICTIPEGKVEFISPDRMTETVDALLSIGGDGSFLGASRIMAKTGKPVLGIHLGGLGFLADVSMDNFEERLTAFFEGNYKIERRSVLNAKLVYPDATETFFAFNDFVIGKGHVLSMIKIRMYVDNDYFNTYRSDGLIIATPTGSTAYSLSVGGPIISPHLNVIAVSPISPHSLSARPVVLSDDQEIRIDCDDLNNDVSLIVDGQQRISLSKVKKIEIQKADFTLGIVRFEGDTFFQTLRTKMNWGLDKRGN